MDLASTLVVPPSRMKMGSNEVPVGIDHWSSDATLCAFSSTEVYG